MRKERLFQLALTLVPGLGDVLVKTLVSYLGSAESVFQASIPKLVKVPGIGPNLARSILNYDLSLAERELEQIDTKEIQLYFYTDEKYPQRLKNIYDAPALIYLSGNAELNHSRTLAIVGTRNATDHGKGFVRELVKDLAASNLIIVSGLAYGIDIEAHKAALKYDIPTIGVLASGLNTIYPQLHAKYARKMIENGGLVSEYSLATGLDPARFPARNRIIAGLSDATLVVEAGNKGGALITADLASGYDREVFAVPGRYNDTYSFGCNQLIKNNIAQAITSAEDLQFYMHWPEVLESTENTVILDEWAFSKDEWAVISTIKKYGNGIHIDELCWKSKIQSTQIANILLNLEFRGIVNSLPGKKYALN
jgi:DNA processing protein